MYAMAESFTLVHPIHEAHRPADGKLKVLITGAAGRIGSYFALHSDDKYDLRLLCRDGDDTSEIEPLGELVVADIGDLDAFKAACEGVDVMLHLAADPSPNATWDSLLPNNIVGGYHAFAAAKHAGVRRVVYASSIHAVSGYRGNRQVHIADPVNPGDLYGVTKCFVEALGRYMAEQEGVQCICVRIAAFQPPEKARQDLSLLDTFVSRRDLNQLLQRAVEAEHLQWAVVHGVSDSRFVKLDITSARELLGYEPQDDLTEMNDELAQLHLHDRVFDHALSSEDQSGLREDV